jgi:hypothetical protein
MNTITTCAALLSAAAVMVPATPAMADGDTDAVAAGGGCVTNAQYGRLAIGQRLNHIRGIVSEQAQQGAARRWWSGANAYQERQYSMCTPWHPAHDTLTVRLMRWEGAWRAQIVDTLVGPEPN